MKKLIILLSLALVSCETTVPQSTIKKLKIEGIPFKVYEIGDCEYIVLENGNATWGSHKGDCHNPKHYYNFK